VQGLEKGKKKRKKIFLSYRSTVEKGKKTRLSDQKREGGSQSPVVRGKEGGGGKNIEAEKREMRH